MRTARKTHFHQAGNHRSHILRKLVVRGSIAINRTRNVTILPHDRSVMAKKLPINKTNGTAPQTGERFAPIGPLSPSINGEDTFRSFIENLPVMFYAVSPTQPHQPRYISPTFERFGYPISDWMNDPDIWDRIIHPEERQDILDRTRAAMESGADIDFEYRIVCKDGEIVWVRDRSCFIKDKNGEPLFWQGVIVDVTERHLVMQELQKREKLYRTLARTIPRTAVLLYDRDYRYSLAEGEQLKVHNWSKEMFEDRTLWQAFSPEVAQEWAVYYDRALRGEDVSFDVENADGAYQVNVRPVRDDDNEIFAGMVMWQDITEKKRANDALKESEGRYRQLFENASDIIYVHDLEGNKVAERVLGYSSEEALAMNMKDIAVPEHAAVVQNQLFKKINGNAKQTVYEVDCVKKDGTRATLEVNSSLVNKDGVPVAVQGIARDVTERKHAEEAMRRSEERYRDLFENANDLIYTHDLKGNFTSLNRAGEIITGYTRDEAVSLNIEQVVAPEFLEEARTMISKKMNGDMPTTYELEIIAKDGHRVTLELSTRLIVSGGLPVGVQGIARDITARRSAEASLHSTVSLFASTFESTADGIVVMGLDRELVTCNKKFIEMWGIEQEVVIGSDSTKMIEQVASKLSEPKRFIKGLDRLYENPLMVESEVLELKDGRMYERYSQPQYMGGEPVGRVCCFRDITERNLAEEKLRYYALHDTLTDLPNRVQFMNDLRGAVDRADGNPQARFAVLFLDLDRFKVINDSLGHAVGDKLLIAFAERLRSCVRPGDVVARLGGDEFTVLLNRSGETEEVVAIAERVQMKIAEPFKIDNYEVFTTASIGIIVSGDVRRQAEDFLRDADAAMYRAKESGKARYEIFDREMHVRNMNLLQVETDLRHAVDRNELLVLYQPIVDLVTGQVNEFEALIRWRHPVHGLVSPDEFIGVAEETGLIIPIGKWILDESCRRIAEWQRRFNFPLAVSVNLSAKQLMHPTLVAQVKDILDETGLEPSQLKLEVTESTVMEHSERSLKVLSDLDQLGVALSTDDFGTGYSSLSYLQRFPFTRLKIDRSFVKIMDDNDKSLAIVKTILMLGDNLGIDVVAEGIETVPQFEKLRMLGCKSGQGFLFAYPIDQETAEQFLADGANVFSADPALNFTHQPSLIEVADVQ
jgi:diguanylate cyclase (GGDEF)-like protein/PAS domain S-box-containing protein